MSNIQIETDLKEIIGELKQGQNRIIDKIEAIDKKVEAIDKRLIKVETRLDEGITPKIDALGEQIKEIKEVAPTIKTLGEQVKEIKGSQQAQIWTLIGILITAVAGFLVAVGRFVFSGNP